MANVSILCKYCSLFIVFSCLCILPLCHTGKMRKKSKNDRIMRSIKKLDRRYSRKVQAMETPEEFIRLFQPRGGVDELAGKLFLERTSLHAEAILDGPGAFHRRLQLDENQNFTMSLMAEVRESMQAQICREPKPVLLDTFETMGIDRGRLLYVLPDCLQVNRCGHHSGCCAETGTCSVKEGSVRNVTRQVLLAAVYTESTGHRKTHLSSVTVEVEEHTECECRETPCTHLRCEGPKTRDPMRCTCICPKRCPTPYLSDGDNCGCKCSDERTSGGRSCRKIFRGKEHMLEAECECVQSQQCSPPLCRPRYYFNNVTCTCTRNPSTSERIADPHDDSSVDAVLFQVEMEVREMTHDAPPSRPPLDEGLFGLGPIVRTMNQQQHPSNLQKGASVSRSGKSDKFGRLPPESNEYRHSSHTTYNDTFDSGPKYNTSRKSTKSKIAPWEESGDEMNATFIKDEYTLDVTSNETEYETTSDAVILGGTDENELTDIHLEKPKKPLEESINAINTFRPDPGTDDTEDSYQEFLLSASSDYYSKFSYSSLEDGGKYETILGFGFEGVNEDQENYEFESSGDTELAGY